MRQVARITRGSLNYQLEGEFQQNLVLAGNAMSGGALVVAGTAPPVELFTINGPNSSILTMPNFDALGVRGFTEAYGYNYAFVDDGLLHVDAGSLALAASDITQRQMRAAFAKGDLSSFQVYSDHYAWLSAVSESQFEMASDRIDQGQYLDYLLLDELGGELTRAELDDFVSAIANITTSLRSNTVEHLISTASSEELLLGDYDADGAVTIQDYEQWQLSLGLDGFGWPADGNRDGMVNIADYTVWRDAYLASTDLTVGTIPEPATVAGMSLAMVAILSVRKLRTTGKRV